ncbi:MAG: hypothetical protein RDU24_08840 [Humidesulfovibrio sp.]|uniref:hypothetical protein n=1 Tax=Humidesulfovibrio sp. TaxID=2910988 RepID=UPI0027EE60EC|nr:hypothetical protein [Humidesulfovibrio sp.]MDQ7835474.1 hypothetical protein [Humidesulfovibrio sp.]
MSGGEALPIIAAIAGVASAGSSVVQALGSGASKAPAQAATPSSPTTTPFSTSSARNVSETQADILRKEQARKAAGASGTESILTGGMGALGNASTQSGAGNLLGI